MGATPWLGWLAAGVDPREPVSMRRDGVKQRSVSDHRDASIATRVTEGRENARERTAAMCIAEAQQAQYIYTNAPARLNRANFWTTVNSIFFQEHKLRSC